MKLEMDQRQFLRSLTRGAYDIQKLRIQTGNRLCATFRSRLGLDSSKKEVSKTDAKKILDTLRAEHKKITDGVKRELPKASEFQPIGVIHNYTELCLIAAYVEHERTELSHFEGKNGRLVQILRGHEIFTQHLALIPGCGPAMSAVILSEFDVHKIDYASQMIYYSGYGVESDGKGTSKRVEHLYDIEYIDAKGKKKTRKGIRHNIFLKTKLRVLAGTLLKAGLFKDKTTGKTIPMTKYVETYLNYKARLETHPVYGVANDKARIKEIKKATGKGYSPSGHRNAMALRYMIKAFIFDLYEKWRTLEGLPVHDPWHTAKLGLRHHSTFSSPYEKRDLRKAAKLKEKEDVEDLPDTDGDFNIETIEDEIAAEQEEMEDVSAADSSGDATPVDDHEIDSMADETMEEVITDKPSESADS